RFSRDWSSDVCSSDLVADEREAGKLARGDRTLNAGAIRRLLELVGRFGRDGGERDQGGNARQRRTRTPAKSVSHHWASLDLSCGDRKASWRDRGWGSG